MDLIYIDHIFSQLVFPLYTPTTHFFFDEAVNIHIKIKYIMFYTLFYMSQCFQVNCTSLFILKLGA